MKKITLKGFVYSLMVAATLIFSAGLFDTTTAQAQDWRRDRWEDRRDRQRNDGWYGGGYGRYGNNSAYRRDQEKGYSDGLNRGQEDARDRRSFNPNNSSHYRNGNGAYRDGFRQGYEQGYRQYARSRRW